MGIGDIRYTVLQTVNEVFRKLGLNTVSTVAANKLSIEMVDFINDICDELSDLGDWHETMVSGNMTAVSGQSDYEIPTSANVKNIGDIYFSTRTGPLQHLDVEKMRIQTRTSGTGVPSQYTVWQTGSAGNPIIRVRPRPGATEDGENFSLVYWIRAPHYTTSDDAAVIPFPARIVVMGVMAKQILNESGGSPSDKYSQIYQNYLMARKDALNRFKGNSGYSVSFVPGGMR